MAWVARMTNQPMSSVLALSGAEFAAALDEAKSADDSAMHEIMRAQCDLLYRSCQILAAGLLGQQWPDWRYPRSGDAEREKANRVSPLDFARMLASG